jgi:hypothetical protein
LSRNVIFFDAMPAGPQKGHGKQSLASLDIARGKLDTAPAHGYPRRSNSRALVRPLKVGGSKNCRTVSLQVRLTTPSPSSGTAASRTVTASKNADLASGGSGLAAAMTIAI